MRIDVEETWKEQAVRQGFYFRMQSDALHESLIRVSTSKGLLRYASQPPGGPNFGPPRDSVPSPGKPPAIHSGIWREIVFAELPGSGMQGAEGESPMPSRRGVAGFPIHRAALFRLCNSLTAHPLRREPARQLPGSRFRQNSRIRGVLMLALGRSGWHNIDGYKSSSNQKLLLAALLNAAFFTS